jgi:nicotinate dehydrogenase subunit A
MPEAGSAMPTLKLNVNAETRTVVVRDSSEPLLYVLRNQLELTGAKYGCGLGQCGACTVIVDGEAVRSCQLPVSRLSGKKVTTIEGLGTPTKPHPLQAAFVTEQAAQCGYCVAGMVMTGAALLARKPAITREDAQQALAGNLCRCGTHERILRAMLRASGKSAACTRSLPPPVANSCRPAARSSLAFPFPRSHLRSGSRVPTPRSASRSTRTRSTGSFRSTPTAP